MAPVLSVVRLVDLQRQGFMKPRKARKPATERPTVACDDCLNWHPKGKHIADAETRKANRNARNAKSKPKAKAKLAPWQKERAWFGAEGVVAKHMREYEGHKARPAARNLEDLLSRPEWFGSDVRDAQDGWTYADAPEVPRNKYNNDPVKERAEGPVLATPRVVVLITHPSGAIARIPKVG